MKRQLSLGGNPGSDAFNEPMMHYQQAKRHYREAEEAGDEEAMLAAKHQMDDAEDHIIALGGAVQQCAYPSDWMIAGMKRDGGLRYKHWMQRRKEAIARILDRENEEEE